MDVNKIVNRITSDGDCNGKSSFGLKGKEKVDSEENKREEEDRVETDEHGLTWTLAPAASTTRPNYIELKILGQSYMN